MTRRRLRSRRGQALVEFALVAPLLLLLILGLIDFARAWNVYQVVTDAAREGARNAVVQNQTLTEGEVIGIVEAALTRASLDLDNATVTIVGFNSGQGNPTTVRVEYDYTLGWVGIFLVLAQGDNQLTLTSEIVMRNE